MATGYRTPNRVDVFCDKPVYIAGDVVQGYVLLTIFEPLAARSVNVEVIGYESVHWTEIRTEEVLVFDGAEEIISKVPRNARRDFFEIDVPLYQLPAGQALAPGQYQFPFRMALPPSLPGTFHFEDESYESDGGAYESVVAKVEYKLKGFVVRGDQQAMRCPHMHDSVEIIVMQRLDRPPSELTAETVKQVKSCCFFQSAGMVVVRLRAAKDRFGSGETAEMLLEIENHTNLRFDEVLVELDRIVVVKARGCSYRSEERLCRRQFPGLPEGTSYVGAGAKRLSLPLPADLDPTTVSNLVTCSYRVWVQLSAGAFTSHPRLQVPITVYGQPPKRPMQSPMMVQQQQQPQMPYSGAGGGVATGTPLGGPQTLGPAVVVNLPCSGLPVLPGQQAPPPMMPQGPTGFAAPQPAGPTAPAYGAPACAAPTYVPPQPVGAATPYANASAPPAESAAATAGPAAAANYPAPAASAQVPPTAAPPGQELLGKELTADGTVMNPMFAKPL